MTTFSISYSRVNVGVKVTVTWQQFLEAKP